MSIKLAQGNCAKCGISGPVIGKREKALCVTHYQEKLRQPKEGTVSKEKKIYTIPKESPRRKRQNEEYKKLAVQLKKEITICQAQLTGCTYKVTSCHHLAGRIELLLIDRENIICVCENCHHIIEMNPEMAKDLKLSKNRL